MIMWDDGNGMRTDRSSDRPQARQFSTEHGRYQPTEVNLDSALSLLSACPLPKAAPGHVDEELSSGMDTSSAFKSQCEAPDSSKTLVYARRPQCEGGAIMRSNPIQARTQPKMPSSTAPPCVPKPYEVHITSEPKKASEVCGSASTFEQASASNNKVVPGKDSSGKHKQEDCQRHVRSAPAVMFKSEIRPILSDDPSYAAAGTHHVAASLPHTFVEHAQVQGTHSSTAHPNTVQKVLIPPSFHLPQASCIHQAGATESRSCLKTEPVYVHRCVQPLRAEQRQHRRRWPHT